MSRITLPLVLRVDAVANIAGGVALAVLSGWLAPLAGLTTTGPVLVLAAVFVANGIANAVVDRRPTPAGVGGLVAVDLAFAVAAVGVALADPTAAEPAVRWAMAAVGDLSAVVGLAKLWTLRAARRGSQGSALTF